MIVGLFHTEGGTTLECNAINCVDNSEDGRVRRAEEVTKLCKGNGRANYGRQQCPGERKDGRNDSSMNQLR